MNLVQNNAHGIRQKPSSLSKSSSQSTRFGRADRTTEAMAGYNCNTGEGFTRTYHNTNSRSDASGTSKKSYERLAEVYSNSGGTVEFVHNFEEYINNIISPFVWIILLILLALWAIVLILIGSFNIPFCSLQPMIPIYLIVTGCLFAVYAAVRVYNIWPVPNGSRDVSLAITLTCKAFEVFIVIAIIVWLILGCIWVYGNRQYVHFDEGMFERHYCDPTTYWLAFINVTLHLCFIATTFLLIAIILFMGIWKETGRSI